MTRKLGSLGWFFLGLGLPEVAVGSHGRASGLGPQIVSDGQIYTLQSVMHFNYAHTINVPLIQFCYELQLCTSFVNFNQSPLLLKKYILRHNVITH